MDSKTPTGKFQTNSNITPEPGMDVVIIVNQRWWHGYLVEIDPTVLVGADGNFRLCVAVIVDPKHVGTQEPVGDYAVMDPLSALWLATSELNRRQDLLDTEAEILKAAHAELAATSQCY